MRRQNEEGAPRKVRYAVIGAGHIAQTAVLPAFAGASDSSELVALVSGDADKRRGLAQRHAIDHTGGYDELEWVIERARADAVYVCTPNHLHREHTERAARAGAHVLCETPLAPTAADCEAMITCCRRAGVQLMVAYRLHFADAYLRALDVIHGGHIGKPKIVSSLHTLAVRHGDIRTRRDVAGGALCALGVYAINVARHVFGDEPVRVMATSTRGDSRFGGVDATTTALLIFEDERIAAFSASLESAETSCFRVVGDRGDLRVEPAYSHTEPLRHVLTVGERQSERVCPVRDQFAAEISAFSRAIRCSADVEPSGEEGLADVRVLDALVESARSGHAIDLPPHVARRRPPQSHEVQIIRPGRDARATAQGATQGHGA